MVWTLFGEVEPEGDWVILANHLESQTLRVEHVWDTEGAFPGKGYALIAQRFSDGVMSNFRRLYPYKDARLYEVSIPDDLVQGGLATCQVAIKLSPYGYYLADANWKVKVYRWQ